jgi:hypothetical protein
MDPIKEAFLKAKQDINELKEHLYYLSQEIEEIKQIIQQTNQQTDISKNSSIQHTDPADNLPLYALKTQNSNTSIRNDGVPADRQTNQQTDQHIGNEGVRTDSANFRDIRKVSQLLSSLDSIKQEVRVKFKNLTPQEMLVFSTIYQLEEEGHDVTYQLISSKLSLTQSSIRDYTQKITKKGIPIMKNKINNKKVLLFISPELKKIASLAAILQLREI